MKTGSCLIIAIGAVAALVVVPVNGDFVEDFESYPAGSGLPLPWSTVGSFPMVASGSEGYGGSQGAYGNSPNWHISERATNYSPLAGSYVLSWKARLSSNNGLARLTAGVGNGVSVLRFEMDQNSSVMAIVWTGGSVPVVEDVWYMMTVTVSKDGVDSFSWEGSYQADGGAANAMGSGSFPAGWAPEKVEMQSIWAWDDQGLVVSSLDDVSFESVAPLTCSEVLEQEPGLLGDVNDDCYVNIEDIAVMAQEWMSCIDPSSEDCEKPWMTQ